MSEHGTAEEQARINAYADATFDACITSAQHDKMSLSNTEWMETARYDGMLFRTALMLCRKNDTEATEMFVGASDDGVEALMTPYDNLQDFKSRHEGLCEVVNAASVRILVGMSRFIRDEIAAAS